MQQEPHKNSGPKPFAFTKPQLEQLRDARVQSAQIAELRTTLALLQILMNSPQARLPDVRDKIQLLRKSLTSAQTQVSRFLAGKSLAAVSAQELVFDSSTRPTRHAADLLEPCLAPLTAALAAIPVWDKNFNLDQRRKAVHSMTLPVQWIDAAMVRGWELTPPQMRARVVKRLGGGTTEYPFTPSSQPNSSFRSVVEICYAAVRGATEANAERAIRAYLRIGGRYKSFETSDAPMFSEVVFYDAAGRRMK